jgi:hypothetical protein
MYDAGTRLSLDVMREEVGGASESGLVVGSPDT